MASSVANYVSLKKRLLSTKTLLTIGSLIAVFFLLYIGRDVTQLEVIVPSILFFYNGANVLQDVMNKRTQALSRGTEEEEDSGLARKGSRRNPAR
jgi:hypothetical protein